MVITMLPWLSVMVITEKTTHGIAFMGSEHEEEQYCSAIDAEEFHHSYFLMLVGEPDKVMLLSAQRRFSKLL